MNPLILLDVDGVLNPFQRPGPAWQAHKAASYGGSCNLWLNPEHGAALMELAEATGAQLAWATMWDHHANTGIAPAIGLPELPVFVMDDREEYGPEPAHVHPKTPVVAAQVNRRPFVWFDDEVCTPSNRRWLEEHSNVGEFLLIQVSCLHGLADKHIAQAREWLTALRDAAA